MTLNSATLILASSNQHKVDELREIFTTNGLQMNIVPVTDVWPEYHVDETGSTFEENAMLKALAVHEHTGLPVLADDSGLEVDVLEGAPGVYSARYAGASATDADNRLKLLQALGGVETEARSAQFRCVLCYMDGTRTLFDEGVVRGAIRTDEHGTNGFGYDPLFVPTGHEETFAQLPPAAKNAMSHRGRATMALIKQLQALGNDVGHAIADDPLPMTDAVIMAAVAAVTQHDRQLRSVIVHFVRSADDAFALYEALLQTYLFAGYPAALDSLRILDEECQRLLGATIWPAAAPFDMTLFRARGEVLCGQIYEGVYERMMERLGTISPDLSEWMIVEGYGKTLSRPQLDVVRRELCIVAMLAALGREQQLYSHIRGAVLVGATEDDVRACADIVYEQCGKEAGSRIEVLLQRIVKDRS